MKFRRWFLYTVLLIAALASASELFAEITFSGQAPSPAQTLALWYRSPAENWMTSALPIGNGRFGAMIFGEVQREHIQFNDKSLWTGSKTERGAYQNFGDVYVDFPSVSRVIDYRRELDLENGIARVQYEANSVEYLREYFASFPDDVVAMRFSASVAGAVNSLPSGG